MKWYDSGKLEVEDIGLMIYIKICFYFLKEHGFLDLLLIGILTILTWRLNSQLRHAGLDPASSVFLDSRLRGNDNRGVFNRRSNIHVGITQR